VTAPLLLFTVPIVASWQRMRVGKGRHYKAPEQRELQNLIAIHAIRARNVWSQTSRSWDPTARFALTIAYHAPDMRRRDVDRVESLVLDALTGTIWLDDSDRYVVDARTVRCDAEGRALVHIGSGEATTHRVATVPEGSTYIIVERVGDPLPAPKRSRSVATRRSTSRAVTVRR
jgi:Holliday junction resolvase RusA-like endonuclease